MHHVEEGEAEAGGQLFDVGQGQRTLVEQAFVHFALDDFIDQILDALRSRALQAARGTLHGIGQTNDAAFLGLRIRSGITEIFLLHGRNILGTKVHDLAAEPRVLRLALGAVVKEAHRRVPVVLADDIDHQVVEFVFQSEVDAFLHVRNNDERTHGRREIVVRIDPAGRVLGEIFRLHHFADIVEVGADAANRRIRPDRFGAGFGEVGHGEAVMVSAGRFEGHALEQRVIEIGRLQPRNVRGDAENVLEHGQDAAHQDGGAHADPEGGEGLPSDHAPIGQLRLGDEARPDLPEHGGEEPNGDADIKTGADELAAAADLKGEKHGDHAGDERNDEKNGVDDRHQERTPQTRHHGAEEPEVTSEQDGKNQRRERIRNEQRQDLQIDAAGVGQHEEALDRGQLGEKDAVDQREARIPVKGLRVIDPELGDRDAEDEQADEVFLERLFLGSAGEDEEAETDGEEREDNDARQPAAGQGFTPRAILDRAAGLAAGQAFFHQLLPMKEFAHSWAASRGGRRYGRSSVGSYRGDGKDAGQEAKAATPGSTLPSRNSRLAPPPVEQWLTLSATPNFLAAVAVSPPPTTVVAPLAVASATASAMALVAPQNFSNSNTPGGPFQMIVLARRMASR